MDTLPNRKRKTINDIIFFIMQKRLKIFFLAISRKKGRFFVRMDDLDLGNYINTMKVIGRG